MMFTAKDLAKAETERKRKVRRLKGIKARKKALRPGRLEGKALEDLRWECFQRDNWRCCDCKAPISWTGMYILARGEMAHIRSRGAGGADDISNVKTLCPKCHHAEHNPKACPKKGRK